MENKVPRKLKKELRKVECIEQSAAYVVPPVCRVKLKESVKLNKWTKRLVRNILREVRRNYKRNMELAMKRQIEWSF